MFLSATRDGTDRTLVVLVAAALAGLLLLPWYDLERIGSVFDLLSPGGAVRAGLSGRPWLLPLAVPTVGAAALAVGPRSAARGRLLALCGFAGFAYLLAQGFAVGLRGPNTEFLAVLSGALGSGQPGSGQPGSGQPGMGQPGMGPGALMLGSALLLIGCRGLAMLGWCRGDAFTTSAIGATAALLGLFVFFPLAKVLAQAVTDAEGRLVPGQFGAKLLDPAIWGLGCLGGGTACGVAWNTLLLALIVAVVSTGLGLAFALIVVKTGFRAKGALRMMTVLPIITPPFVIGLALILMFGRAGAVTGFLFRNFGIPPSRWIYGLPGVAIAQCLAFTPIAFLVLVGVVQGISPSLEEAAQMLRARRWTIFRTVTWPLLRPGIAAAFLLSFIESMADFGNPLVLGGNFEVLSTKIFFAVVGASTDPARAAVLSIVLLLFTLAVFALQEAWIGGKTYTTVTGKGDAGLPTPLPRRAAVACYAVAIPWAIFTLAVYGLILVGGFVRAVGRDYTPTLAHYLTAFRIESGPGGLTFAGSAWQSLIATTEVSLVAAPLTAAIGILTAYLLTRQSFTGRKAFEFATMLSFAIPGTVVGVSYVLAFNVPPIEITGGGLILVICFVFRNMPVGVRAGMATLSQIDRSLDEASLTLGARSATTLRRVTLPLLRPAITASLIYGFVRAMTAVSAVIFLVSAEYNMATTYIIGRVDAGEYGVAIAYSSALIVFMLLVVVVFDLLVGERRLGRRRTTAPRAAPPLLAQPA